MAKKSLFRELEKQEPEELLRLLEEVSKRFPVAEMYLRMEFGFEPEPIIEKYRKALTKEYFPTRGRGKARVSRSEKILKEFALVSAFPEDLLEMQWFHLNLSLRYHFAFGHEYEPFIRGIFRTWEKILDQSREMGQLATCAEKLEAMIPGWARKAGLYEALLQVSGLNA